jgi:hypothetical protein
MNEKIIDDELYTPRELSQITEFRQYFGKRKTQDLSDNSVYLYILQAIRKKSIEAKNYGNGKTPYYKIWGSDAKAFIQRTFK